ncbi:unnamed protein product [Arctogadus glacialis]
MAPRPASTSSASWAMDPGNVQGKHTLCVVYFENEARRPARAPPAAEETLAMDAARGPPQIDVSNTCHPASTARPTHCPH